MTTTQTAGAQSPRTDAAISSHAESTDIYGLANHYNDLLDFARTLERELSAANQDLGLTRIALEQKSAQLENCETALQSAHAALADEKKLSAAISRDCNATALERNELMGKLAKAEAALAEAQRQIRTIRHDCLAPAFELTARLCAIRVVAEKDDYELIRRESVMDFVVRWRQTIDKLPSLSSTGEGGGE